MLFHLKTFHLPVSFHVLFLSHFYQVFYSLRALPMPTSHVRGFLFCCPAAWSEVCLRSFFLFYLHPVASECEKGPTEKWGSQASVVGPSHSERGSQSLPVSMPSLTMQRPLIRRASQGSMALPPSRATTSPGTKRRESSSWKPASEEETGRHVILPFTLPSSVYGVQ